MAQMITDSERERRRARGDALRARRQRLGLSRFQVARLVDGLTPGAVQWVEAGEATDAKCELVEAALTRAVGQS